MRRLLLDLTYGLAALITAPIWLVRMLRSGKIRTDWRARFGYGARLEPTDRPRILFHAVSVGEVNTIRTIVDALTASAVRPDIVIATTTDTGTARARTLFSDRHEVVRYPFDTGACRRFLDRVEPSIVALVELEVWPNFTALCAERGIPVGVINGRLTARSSRRYQRVHALIAPSFGRLSFVAAQNETIRERFVSLGVDPVVSRVLGTMKWDTAEITDEVEGADELAVALGIDRSRPLVVAGSTAPEEHALLDAAVPDDVQLLCAPRRPEWFDDAAQALGPCVRRSQEGASTGGARFLLDTIGELRQAYALADVVVIGRTFGSRHGSNMMEAVALGKPVVVGPAVEDFQDAADALLEGHGMIQTNRAELAHCLRSLLDDADSRHSVARAGRTILRSFQGSTARHVELLLTALPD